jgi:hypothetical protein
MKNRFVVGVDALTKEQEKEFVEYLRGRKCGWWHWIDNFWLITNSASDLSLSEIRDELLRIAPEVRVFVLDMSDPKRWIGQGPKSDERNMFSWLQKTWNSD